MARFYFCGRRIRTTFAFSRMTKSEFSHRLRLEPTGLGVEVCLVIGSFIVPFVSCPRSQPVAHFALGVLDLRDLAKRRGKESDFAKQVAALREAHSRKPSFLARLIGKGI